MDESESFENAAITGDVKENPVKDALNKYMKKIMLISFVVALWCVGFYVSFYFYLRTLTTYLMTDWTVLLS
eukprot:UN32374